MSRMPLLTIAICSLISGCADSPSDEIGYGEIIDGNYSNSYFDMSIQFPKSWSMQSKESLEQITEMGKDLFTGDDENLKAVISLAEQQTLNLFSAFQYELGSPVDFNPSIMGVAENVKQQPGVKNGSDYLFHAKRLIKSGQLSYEFPNEIYAEEISGTTFDILAAQADMGDLTIRQKYYAARVKNYVLVFVITYTSDTEEESLIKIMRTLNFSK